MSISITKKQFTVLSELYNYYNRKLFLGDLPECMVSLVRSLEFHGAFLPNCWEETSSESSPVHEIILNPFSMLRSTIEWHSTLVHEMCHLYIQSRGVAPSRGYHCKRWAGIMKHVGLQPSHNALPGGKETGRNMSHYIIKGGAFERAFNKISAKDIAKYNLPYQSLIGFLTRPTTVANEAPSNPIPETRSGIKICYQCTCGNKVWGKPDLQLLCLNCESEFEFIHPLFK